MSQWIAYKNPTKNLSINSIILVVAKLEAIEKLNPQNNANLNTFKRPHVSDLNDEKKNFFRSSYIFVITPTHINPQKCDVNTTPMKLMALINPCSVVVMSMSHFAAGRTIAMFRPSIITPKSNKIAF